MPLELPATSVIADVIDKYGDELIALRRDLHAHPELSWAETRTSDVVVAQLKDLGFSVTVPEGGGVLADIGSGDRLVALRADLDALPVDDLTTDPWKSTIPGVAHACGHDVHTAALVGAGLALPGLVSPSGTALLVAPNLGWADLAAGDLPVVGGMVPRVGNEADLAARTVAEVAPGRPGPLADFVYLSGEVGIGGSVVLGGTVYLAYNARFNEAAIGDALALVRVRRRRRGGIGVTPKVEPGLV